MIVGDSREYLKIIVKIMKKNKILIKVLSVLCAIAFIAVFCLGVILPIISRSTSSASVCAFADENDTNYWEEYDGQTTSFKANSYVFNDDFTYNERWNTLNGYSDFRQIHFNFISNGYFCNYIYCRFIETEELVLGYNIYYPDDGDFSEIDLYFSSSGGWIDLSWQYITFAKGDFPSVLRYFLVAFAQVDTDTGSYKDGFTAGETNGYDKGHDEGLSEGYDNGYIAGEEAGYDKGHDEGLTEGYDNGYIAGEEDGYNKGHSDGYNKGLTANFTNPVNVFLEPVHNFLNINIFGVISIGTILSVVLFVSLAIIFIKMFAGG